MCIKDLGCQVGQILIIECRGGLPNVLEILTLASV